MALHFRYAAAAGAWAQFATLDVETHEDFKPQQLKPSDSDYEEVSAQIQKDITNHDVFLFMKASFYSRTASYTALSMFSTTVLIISRQ